MRSPTRSTGEVFQPALADVTAARKARFESQLKPPSNDLYSLLGKLGVSSRTLAQLRAPTPDTTELGKWLEMGLSDHFIVAKSDAPDCGLSGAQPLGGREGWQYARAGWRGPDPYRLMDGGDILQVSARALGVPALYAYIIDDAQAAIYWSDGHGSPGWLAIGPSYDSDNPDVEHDRQWNDPIAHREAADALGAWSASFAPKATTGRAIVDALVSLEDAGFAAEGIRWVDGASALSAIFEDLLGFPSLYETVYEAGGYES